MKGLSLKGQIILKKMCIAVQFMVLLLIRKFDLKYGITSKYSYSLILIALCSSCVSKTQEKDNLTNNIMTNMTFKQIEQDFGKIPIGKSVSILFKFSNTGANPLLISKVTTSCGCTVAEWPKDIIESNKKGEIKIVYDAKYPGSFDKTITVVYNGKNSPQQLVIKGNVPYPEKENESSDTKNNRK